MDNWMKGNELEDQADRIINSTTNKCFPWLFSYTKHKAAAKLYAEAVEKFLAANDCEKAAKTRAKLAECYLKLGRNEEAMYAYFAAADWMKAVKNNNVLISYLERAVAIAILIRQFNRAAESSEEYATYFQSMGQIGWAIHCNAIASNFYEIYGPAVFAEQCRFKIALQAASVERYQMAKEIFEDMAKKSLSGILMKCAAPGYLLNAGICLLCEGNIAAMTDALNQYQKVDPSFSETREYRFFSDAIISFENADLASFKAAVHAFDPLAHLETWKTTLLLKVEEKLKAREMERLKAREMEKIFYITGA